MKNTIIYSIIAALIFGGTLFAASLQDKVKETTNAIKQLEESIKKNSDTYNKSQLIINEKRTEVDQLTAKMASLDLQVRGLNNSIAIQETIKTQMNEMNDKNRLTKAMLEGLLQGYLEREGFQRENQSR